jgi:hypothetical protein
MFLMDRTSIRFRRMAWLAVLALMLPLFYQPVMMSAAHGLKHICSIAAHQKGSQDDGKSESGKTPSCPICLSLHFHKIGFVPPAVIALNLVYLTRLSVLKFVEHRQTAAIIPTSAWPHAPPSFT